MISVVGLGNAASSIAELFSSTPEYNVYRLASKIKRGKNKKVLKEFRVPEEYEKNVPNLKNFFKDIDDEVQFFYCWLVNEFKLCAGRFRTNKK